MRKACARQHAAPQWFVNDVVWWGAGRRGFAPGLPKILSAIIHNEAQTGDVLWQQQWWNDISSVRLTFLEVVDVKDVSFACFPSSAPSPRGSRWAACGREALPPAAGTSFTSLQVSLRAERLKMRVGADQGSSPALALQRGVHFGF